LLRALALLTVAGQLPIFTAFPFSFQQGNQNVMSKNALVTYGNGR
jgi:hypothetical protein